MALTRENSREIKRHHIALWARQFANAPGSPTFRDFVRSKFQERGLNADKPIRVAGSEVDVLDLLEDDLSTYAQ